MVSIIIPSYNTRDLLLSCLSSIKKTLQANEYEVIVVDNASKDDTVAVIKKAFPQIQVIVNTENVGFARAINIGAAKATGEYLLFLNSDTNITDNFLSGVTSLFASETKLGAVGITMVSPDGTPELSYGSFYTYWSLYRLLFLPKKKKVTRHKIDTDWVSGGCFFITKKLFDTLTGFDEEIFMYVEDVEICYRIKKMGYKVWYVPDYTVMHMGQGSSNRAFAITQIYKGILHFYRKHKSPIAYMGAKLLLIKKAVLSIILGGVTGNKTLVKTYTTALKNI